MSEARYGSDQDIRRWLRLASDALRAGHSRLGWPLVPIRLAIACADERVVLSLHCETDAPIWARPGAQVLAGRIADGVVSSRLPAGARLVVETPGSAEGADSPETHPDSLRRLALLWPDQVERNPALPLIAIESASAYQEIAGRIRLGKGAHRWEARGESGAGKSPWTFARSGGSRQGVKDSARRCPPARLR